MSEKDDPLKQAQAIVQAEKQARVEEMLRRMKADAKELRVEVGAVIQPQGNGSTAIAMVTVEAK